MASMISHGGMSIAVELIFKDLGCVNRGVFMLLGVMHTFGDILEHAVMSCLQSHSRPRRSSSTLRAGMTTASKQ